MLVGILCLLVVLLDAFQTVILPRRAAGRLRRKCAIFDREQEERKT